MGCCQSDSRPPLPAQIMFKEDTELIAEKPKRSKKQLEKHDDIVLQPALFSHTNVEVSKQKEIRLERLMEGKSFVYDFRCEFLFNYFIFDNKEHYQSVKGNLYFFDKYLYFYCPTQVSIQPYGEFIRYMDKSEIQFTDRDNDTVFTITMKNQNKFQFKVTRNQDEFITKLNEVARELKLA